jgi:peptidoglycan biosynthesis protein MviN/MurJ (putative lipid II flippase)
MRWLLLICAGLAALCEAILHKHHGRRWPGLAGLIGAVAILFSAVFWPNEDVTPLLWLFWAYLGALLVARVSILNRPFGKYMLPFLSERLIKGLIEPLLVFLVGVVLLPLSEPVGGYLILAAWGLFVSTNAAEMWMRSRVEQLHDSVIEQREIAERFRDSDGNEW